MGEYTHLTLQHFSKLFFGLISTPVFASQNQLGIILHETAGANTCFPSLKNMSGKSRIDI